jgi:hypothetical protein
MRAKLTNQPKPGEPQLGGIVERPPGELKPWPNNPRTHSEKQLTKLAASMREFGFTAPVLVDEAGVILSGHGRVEAAVRIGLVTVPTRVLAGLTATGKRAYVIADNNIAELSAWDGNLLKAELEILIQEDFAVELTGFSTAEIDFMLDDPAQAAADPDDLRPEDIAPEVVSRPGDLWRLGNHFLLCGDALRPDNYQRVMQGGVAQMAITDPPYNVPIAGHVCGNGKVKHKEFAMASGEMSSTEFIEFLRAAFVPIHTARQDGAVTFLHGLTRPRSLPPPAAVGPPASYARGQGQRRDGHLLPQPARLFEVPKGDALTHFELASMAATARTCGTTRRQHLKGSGYQLLALHPTVKPVGLIADAMRDCSHRKAVILDPFAGSGTVLIAAERTGRHARAIELDPQYVDVGVHRWQRVTGRQAVLDATGQTWDQMRAERLASHETQEEPR